MDHVEFTKDHVMKQSKPQEKQEWQAPQLEVIRTAETESGEVDYHIEVGINNPSE